MAEVVCIMMVEGLVLRQGTEARTQPTVTSMGPSITENDPAPVTQQVCMPGNSRAGQDQELESISVDEPTEHLSDR